MDDPQKPKGSTIDVLFQDVSKGRALKLVLAGVLGAIALVLVVAAPVQRRPSERMLFGSAKVVLQRRWQQFSHDPRYAKLTISEFVFWASAEIVYRGLADRRALNLSVPAAQEFWSVDGSDWTADSVTLDIRSGSQNERLELGRPKATVSD